MLGRTARGHFKRPSLSAVSHGQTHKHVNVTPIAASGHANANDTSTRNEYIMMFFFLGAIPLTSHADLCFCLPDRESERARERESERESE